MLSIGFSHTYTHSHIKQNDNKTFTYCNNGSMMLLACNLRICGGYNNAINIRYEVHLTLATFPQTKALVFIRLPALWIPVSK